MQYAVRYLDMKHADQFEPSTLPPSQPGYLRHLTVYCPASGEFEPEFSFGLAEYMHGFFLILGIEEFCNDKMFAFGSERLTKNVFKIVLTARA